MDENNVLQLLESKKSLLADSKDKFRDTRLNYQNTRQKLTKEIESLENQVKDIADGSFMKHHAYGEHVYSIVVDELDFPQNFRLNVSFIYERFSKSRSDTSHLFSKKSARSNSEIEFKLCLNIGSIHATEFNDMLEKRFKGFVEGMGIEYNQYIQFILTVIHEFGHIEMLNDLVTKYDVPFHAATSIPMTDTADIRQLFSRKARVTASENNHDLFYRYGRSELYADRFALENFPRIWKRLQQEGIEEYLELQKSVDIKNTGEILHNHS